MKRNAVSNFLILFIAAVSVSTLWTACDNRSSRLTEMAEAVVLSDPGRAATLLARADTASFDEETRALMALTQALIRGEHHLRDFSDTAVCLQVTDKSWEFHRPVTNMINCNRGPILGNVFQLHDGSLSRAYDYYNKKSLGGTSENREAVRLFGRTCYALSSQYNDTDSLLQFDQLIHLAIHAAEASEDWGIAYRAYHRWAKHVIGSNHHGNSKYSEGFWAISQAIHSFDHCRDYPQHLLTLLNDYGFYYLRVGQFMCIDPQCFSTILHAASLLHAQQERPPYDVIFQLIDSVEKAPTLGFFWQAEPSSALIPLRSSTCIANFEDFQQRKARAEEQETSAHTDFLKTLFSKYMTDAARTFEVESRNYLAPGYVRKATMLQSRLLTTIIALLSLVVAVVLLLFWIWRFKMQQRHKMERAEHLREAELLTERLQQKDTMITMLRGHIMDKSELLEKLQKIKDGNRRNVIDARNWREIEATLDAVDNGFVSRLRERYPQFSEENIRLCMLTRLKLSNYALSNIYFISVSAIQHRKQKLKKEGFGVTDPNLSLEQIVMAL